jgi:predicted transcriptional regulator
MMTTTSVIQTDSDKERKNISKVCQQLVGCLLLLFLDVVNVSDVDVLCISTLSRQFLLLCRSPSRTFLPRDQYRYS